MGKKKIYILGASGSGKSFLANKLSCILKIKHYDMDDVRFIKKFTKARTKKQRKQIVSNILKKKRWIIDARGTDWDRHSMLEADLIIWMKTSLHKRLPRIFKRYLERGNNADIEEKFLDQFSLAKYSLSYRFGKRTTSFNSTKKFLEENNLKIIIIKNRKQVNKFLEGIK